MSSMGAAIAQTAPATTPSAAPVTAPASTPATSTIGAGLSTPSPALPQPNPNLTSNAALPERRGYLRLEPFFAYPWIGFGAGHNDNLTGTPTNKISSAFGVLSPRITAEAVGGGHRHSLTYAGNYGRYTNSSADNYNDHELVLSTSNQFNARVDLNATLFYQDKVDPRGLLARPLSAEPDHYHAWGAFGTFGYGARTAQGRLEADFGVTGKSYTNNQQITQAFDVGTTNVAGRFLYRIAPRTRLLAEVRLTEYDYKWSESRLDNQEARLLAGVTWDAAAATSGTVKVGWMTKDFKDAGLKDYRGANIEAALRWMPRSYSTVEVVARRSAIDSAGTGVYTVDSTVGILWNHRWQQYLFSRAVLSHTNSDFQGITRTDKFNSASIGGYFDMRTWLRLGIEISHQRRDSTDANVQFSRNILMLTLGWTI
jgi:hypothetical protein